MPARKRKTPAARAALVSTFTPDPQHLLPAVGSPSGAPASQRFRVQRPRDLVNLQVSAYDCELVVVDGVAVLQPLQGTKARIEVRLPFQHLGEESVVDPDPTPTPPIRARAAYGTRLVFSVPEGEQVPYSVEGVLAALSRLPLVVVPLALPARQQLLKELLPLLVRIADLPGGIVLSRGPEGLVLTTSKKRVPTDAITTALDLTRARQALGRESATNLTGLALTDLADLLINPSKFPIRKLAPRSPRTDETAIEAPFRLLMSPSSKAGWAHATAPVEASEGRVELWHSRLGVRTEDGGVSELENREKLVRAVWNRDRDLGYGDGAHDDLPFTMSLDSRDRHVLVTQTSDPRALVAPRPVDAHKLYLTALGAYLDLHGYWPADKASGINPEILSWDHIAPMGRDQFVKVVYPGYLFPFGHSAALVKQTVRRVDGTTNPVAQLHTEFFLVVTDPVRSYDQLDMPFSEVRVRPVVTPSLLEPATHGIGAYGQMLFWPTLTSGDQLQFVLECLDRDGRRIRVQAPLLFVGEKVHGPDDGPGLPPVELPNPADVISAWTSAPVGAIGIDALRQHIAVAPSSTPGETAVETTALRFTGVPAPAPRLDSTPSLVQADVVLPAAQRLSGSASSTTVSYPQPYLDHGFGAGNDVLQQFLEVLNPVEVDFTKGSDKGGGFLAPNLAIKALTLKQGAVADPAGYSAAGFDPKTGLGSLLPKLFGLFSLVDLLDGIKSLDLAPKVVTAALDEIAALIHDLGSLESGLQDVLSRVAADASSAPTKGMQDAAKAAEAALTPQVAAVKGLTDTVLKAIADLQNGTAVAEAAFTGDIGQLTTALTTLKSTLAAASVPTATRAAITGPLDAVLPLLSTAGQVWVAVQSFIKGAAGGLTQRASYTWFTPLSNWTPGQAAPPTDPDKALFIAKQGGGKADCQLSLTVKAQPTGANAGADVTAELTDFALNLFPDAPLVRLVFDRLAFHAGTSGKADVDVAFEGIEFQGVLGFVNTLRELIPFDGFSDPPYLDVSVSGLRAGFDLGLPSVGIGVFSLENISLHAGVNVPFLGDAVTVEFAFCSREKPFRLTVLMIGGGGFVGMALSPKGMVLLEMSLEAGACLAIDLGVASGSVSIMVGVYLRLEGSGGSLTGYFRIRGEVDVLGLISASITLELSLKYDFGSGKLIGRASLDIEVDIFLISFSVSVSCERKLAGSNGDPTYLDLLEIDASGVSPEWDAYCAAFANG